MMRHTYGGVVLTLLLAVTMGASTKNTDLMQLSQAMQGTWKCSYTTGKQTATYQAVFGPAADQSWLHERDTWAGGGGDEAFLTYDPGARQWTWVVLEGGQGATVFVAKGGDSRHLVFHSAYPNATMTNVFDRVSPTKYTLRFTQMARGKTSGNFDVCAKQ